MRFVVAITHDVLADLDARADLERQREQAWLQAARERALGAAAGSLRQRARALAAVRAEHAHLREAGQLLGSRDALLAVHVRRLLRHRGWDHDWPAPPAGATSTPGRRWGVVPGERGGRARLPVQLPDDLGERVRLAAWWTSAEAVQELIEWQERWGPGPGAALGEAAAGNPMAAIMMFSAALHRPSAEEMAARDAARSKIVTVGDILRLAAVRATGT
jgi:hypothetical protein